MLVTRLKVFAIVLLALMPAFSMARRGVAQAQGKANEAKLWEKSRGNLQLLALAMHNYHDDRRSLPPAAVLDKDKKPLLSWRVLLLPYLDQKDLFHEFILDESWDSAHNKKLFAKMPKVFAPVTGKHEPGTTFYQVFVGKGTAFEGIRGLRLLDITDGTSNTAMIIEGGETVPWTKPADLVFDAKMPLPKLGGLFKDRIHVALVDGSVTALRPDFNERQMRFFIGRNDGEVLIPDELFLKK
jgi:hypothetical protein